MADDPNGRWNNFIMRHNLILFSITLLAFACFCNHANAVKAEKEATPEYIVQKILAQSKPQSGPFVPMTDKRLEQIAQFLTPELNKALAEWVHTRLLLSTIGQRPEGAYDPLILRKWQPDMESIKQAEISENKATVVVKESLNSSKIYSGYHGETRFIFIKYKSHWLLENIKIRRRHIATPDQENEDILDKLKRDSVEFIRLYNNNRSPRKTQGPVQALEVRHVSQFK